MARGGGLVASDDLKDFGTGPSVPAPAREMTASHKLDFFSWVYYFKLKAS